MMNAVDGQPVRHQHGTLSLTSWRAGEWSGGPVAAGGRRRAVGVAARRGRRAQSTFARLAWSAITPMPFCLSVFHTCSAAESIIETAELRNSH